MPYNCELEQHIDVIALSWPGIEKKKMFGGLCYQINGHIAFGIYHDGLIVRLGCESRAGEAMSRPHIRPFDITGRPMRGWILVSPAGWTDEIELDLWLVAGRECAERLPAKTPKDDFSPLR